MLRDNRDDLAPLTLAVVVLVVLVVAFAVVLVLVADAALEVVVVGAGELPPHVNTGDPIKSIQMGCGKTVQVPSHNVPGIV